MYREYQFIIRSDQQNHLTTREHNWCKCYGWIIPTLHQRRKFSVIVILRYVFNLLAQYWILTVPCPVLVINKLLWIRFFYLQKFLQVLFKIYITERAVNRLIHKIDWVQVDSNDQNNRSVELKKSSLFELNYHCFMRFHFQIDEFLIRCLDRCFSTASDFIFL